MKKAAAEKYRDIDFSRARRGPVVKPKPGKTKISIRLDNTVVQYFRELVGKAGGGNYQTLITRHCPIPIGRGQRRAPAARPLERDVRRRVALDILSKDRRASLTAAELRKALATSGSRTPTFAPSFRRRR
jgi:hypothetical protein